MNEQILTLRDFVAYLRKPLPDYGDAREGACSGGNFDDSFSEGADWGAINGRNKAAYELEALINEHLLIYVTEGLEPDDADFIYRHVIGRRPEEIP